MEGTLGRWQQLEKPMFSGEDPDAWIARVEEYFLKNRFSEQEKVMFIEEFLEGQAFQWFLWEDRRRPFVCWSAFKINLLQRFRPTQRLLSEMNMEEQRRFVTASEIARSSTVEVREPTSAFEWGIATELRQKSPTEETQPVLSVDFVNSCGVIAKSGVYRTGFHDSGPIGSYLHVVRVGVSNSGGIGSNFGDLGTASRDLRSGSLNSRVVRADFGAMLTRSSSSSVIGTGSGIFKPHSSKGWAGFRNSGRIWIGCRDSGAIGANFRAIGNGPRNTNVFWAGIGNLGVNFGEISAVSWAACADRATSARFGLDFLILARLRLILVQLEFTLENSASLGQGMQKLVCLEFKLGSLQVADLKLPSSLLSLTLLESMLHLTFQDSSSSIWEGSGVIRLQFLDLHLEDKVFLWGGSNDRNLIVG